MEQAWDTPQHSKSKVEEGEAAKEIEKEHSGE